MRFNEDISYFGAKYTSFTKMFYKNTRLIFALQRIDKYLKIILPFLYYYSWLF